MLKRWWLWRLKPHPKKLLATDLELPLSYLANDAITVPRDSLTASRWVTMGEAGEEPEGTLLRHLELELGQHNVPTDGHVFTEPIGAMRALRIDVNKPVRGAIVPRGAKRPRASRYWLTPPVEQFLDAKKHIPEETLRIGAPALDRERRYTYWVNREVFERTGEFLAGSLEATRVVNVKDTQKVIDLMQEEGETNEVGQLILVALDAYLAGDRPDPRFNPGRSAPRGKVVTVYHGTRHASSILEHGFEPSTGGEFGPGIYFSENPDTAAFYAEHVARGSEPPTVMMTKVDIARFYEVRKVDWIKKTQSRAPRTVQAALKREGHTGIVGIAINDYERQIVAFDTSSIVGPITAARK